MIPSYDNYKATTFPLVSDTIICYLDFSNLQYLQINKVLISVEP